MSSRKPTDIPTPQFHTAENVAKMSHGQPLTDADRWDWLILLRKAALKALASSVRPSGVVVTCSALKAKYRDVMRVASYNNPSIEVHFVFLNATQEMLLERVASRKNHYMGPEMVRSQFESLEVPTELEKDVLWVDVKGTKEEVEENALEKVRKFIKEELERDQ